MSEENRFTEAEAQLHFAKGFQRQNLGTTR